MDGWATVRQDVVAEQGRCVPQRYCGSDVAQGDGKFVVWPEECESDDHRNPIGACADKEVSPGPHKNAALHACRLWCALALELSLLLSLFDRQVFARKGRRVLP